MTEVSELIAHLNNGQRADEDGVMVIVGRHAVVEAIRLLRLLGETEEALAACQSEGQGWKRLAEERAWKYDSYEYLLSEPGEKTLYWAAVAVANAIHAGIGPMIKGTDMEADLRNALCLRDGELRDVPKGSTVRTTVTVQPDSADVVTVHMDWKSREVARMIRDHQKIIDAKRKSCPRCYGTGAVDAPTSADDPSCPECDGEGTWAK